VIRGYERGMKNLGLLTTASLIALLTLACGSDKKAKSPESNSGITETSSQPDMPPAPTKDDPTKTAEPAKDPGATPAGPAGGMIPLAALKVVPSAKAKPAKGAAPASDKPIELKADGTVIVDGKTVGKFAGDEVKDASGSTLVTIGLDGSLVGNGVKNGMKFQGDEIVAENGNKLAIAEDGTLNATREGKTEAFGKVEGGTAKRATLILVALFITPNPIGGTLGAEKKATPDKPGTKTATDAKPADKKTPAKK